MYVFLKLTKGYAMLDYDDYRRLGVYKWHLSNGYVTRMTYNRGKRKQIWMHREVNSTPEGYITDHINGDKLDNRRCNLRTATKSQNAANFGKRRDNKSGGYRGVQKNTNCKTFMARIRKNGIVRYLGSFKTQEDAARAYDKAAKELFGEFANLNFS